MSRVLRKDDRRCSASRLDATHFLSLEMRLQIPLQPVERQCRERSGAITAELLIVLRDSVDQVRHHTAPGVSRTAKAGQSGPALRATEAREVPGRGRADSAVSTARCEWHSQTASVYLQW